MRCLISGICPRPVRGLRGREASLDLRYLTRNPEVDSPRPIAVSTLVHRQVVVERRVRHR